MMELDLSDLHDYLMYDTIRSGRVPEPATASVIQSLLSSGDVFVDIGANNGYFSLIAARQVGPSGKVYSFEPTPPTYTKLVRNLTINGMNQVRSHELAIGSVGGVGQLTQSDVESGLNTLLDRGEMSIAVRVATLDSVLGNQRVDLMKIDVEGSELEVLEGMSTVLASNRNLKLIIEWNPRYAEEKLFKVLAENFQIHCLAFSVNRTFYKRVAKVQEIPGFCNLFCTRGADAPATLFHSVRTS